MKTSKSFLILYLIVLTSLIVNLGCKKENTIKNNPPMVRVGADQTITSPQNYVFLDGNDSYDPDGFIVTHQWAKLAGPSFVFKPSHQYPPRLYANVASNLEVGVYQFELQLKDNNGLTATDTIQVTVNQDTIIRDLTKIKRIDSLQWEITSSCSIRINNIYSGIPPNSNIQVFIRVYNNFYGSSGWGKLEQVSSSKTWYEIQNDVLIIHAPASIDCNFDDSHYEVLIIWN